MSNDDYEDDDDEVPDYGPPEDYISADTLAAVRGSTAAVTDELVAQLARDPGSLIAALDPVTSDAIDAASGIGAGLPEDGPTPLDHARAVPFAGLAVLSGYTVGRIMLGTDGTDVRWSQEPEDIDALLMTQEIEIGEINLSRAWMAATGRVIDALVQDIGFVRDDEPISSLAAIAFDTGVCMALLEHDQYRLRGTD